uniref:Histone-lysine N-methyltransferase SETMAR n=1 Tax=Schistocephalus solidus TaxID=70667 RepID=A0A0X3NSN9_SCHSO
MNNPKPDSLRFCEAWKLFFVDLIYIRLPSLQRFKLWHRGGQLYQAYYDDRLTVVSAEVCRMLHNKVYQGQLVARELDYSESRVAPHQPLSAPFPPGPGVKTKLRRPKAGEDADQAQN